MLPAAEALPVDPEEEVLDVPLDIVAIEEEEDKDEDDDEARDELDVMVDVVAVDDAEVEVTVLADSLEEGLLGLLGLWEVGSG